MTAVNVRRLAEADWPELMRMAAELFPDEDRGDLAVDMRRFLARGDGAVFVAEARGELVGYVQVGERPYADGCASSPVAFIEEWYVGPDARRRGVGRMLLRAAEDWARSRGRVEMASDSLLDNSESHAAHLGSGYAEVERAIRYRKPLI